MIKDIQLLSLTIMSVMIVLFFVAIILIVLAQNKKIAELKTVLLKYVPEILDLLKTINNK